MGTVCGGMRYGPEGALFRQAAAAGDKTWNQLADDAEAFFNYLPGSITFNPAWDIAPWALTKTPNPGERGADHIHVCWPMATQSDNSLQYSTPPFNRSVAMGTLNTINSVRNAAGFQESTNFAGLNSFGIKQSTEDEVVGIANGPGKHLRQNVVIHYCRKVIKINRNEVPWMTDYTVNVNLLNCIPLSSRADSGSKRQGHSAGASNIWVNKCQDYFVINVAWVADDFNDQANPQDYSRVNAIGIPWAKRNKLEELAAFALPQIPIDSFTTNDNFREYNSITRNMPGEVAGTGQDILGVVNSDLTPGTGLSNLRTEASYFTPVTPILYPSVSYEIIGHSVGMTSKSPRGSALTLGATPTIELI